MPLRPVTGGGGRTNYPRWSTGPLYDTYKNFKETKIYGKHAPECIKMHHFKGKVSIFLERGHSPLPRPHPFPTLAAVESPVKCVVLPSYYFWTSHTLEVSIIKHVYLSLTGEVCQYKRKLKPWQVLNVKYIHDRTTQCHLSHGIM